MNKSLLTLTASAFILATTMGMAQAQSTGDDAMQSQGAEQGQQGDRMNSGDAMRSGDRMNDDRERKKKYDRNRDRHAEMMRRHHGGYRMGHGRGMGGGMGGGMDGGMGHRGMMQVVFAMMDADGNGTLSLQEVQDAHARIFAHMDADDDDQVTKREIRAFFHGGKDHRGSSRRDRSERSGDRSERSGDRSSDTGDDMDLNLTDEVEGDDNDNNNNN